MGDDADDGETSDDLLGRSGVSVQEGMVFQAGLSPGRGIYVQQIVCLLPEQGFVDRATLKEAWERTFTRHPGLRLAFPIGRDDRPAPTVADDVVLPWDEHDWGESDDAAAMLEAWLVADRERGFDTRIAPLMRVNVMSLGPGREQMVWTFHHALLDGLSHAVILAEVLSAAERGAPAGRATWPQIASSARHTNGPDEAFWRDYLAGFDAPSPIEVGRPPRDIATRSGAGSRGMASARVSAAITTSLVTMARSEGLTLATLVTAAWALLVGRYAGTEDVVVGTTRSVRANDARVGTHLGVLINTVPLRVDLARDTAVRQWLAQVRRDWLVAREHLTTPLSVIQACAQIPRGSSLFETIVVYDDQRIDARVRDLGVAWAAGRVSLRQTTHYALALAAYGTAELVLELDYDATRFDRRAIERLLGHLEVLLEALPNGLDRRLHALPLVAPRERAMLLTLASGAVTPLSTQRLEALFHAQAIERPEALAVAFEGGTSSFATLAMRAAGLARVLRDHGVQPRDRVGVMLERSLELPVGLLACLMAGAAYVPLDTTWPTRRIAELARDIGLRHVLVPDVGSRELEGVVCIGVTSRAEALASGDACNDDAAYVLFTSGSTGRPNPVACTHVAVINLLEDLQRLQPIGPGDRASLFSAIGFDVSVYEVFSALVSGAALDIVPESIRADGDALASWIVAREITSAYLPPYALPALARALEEASTPPRLRRLLVGVEPIAEALLGRIARAAPDLVVINGYGPTEATICATLHVIPPDAVRPERAPIGRPVGNSRTLVLDVHGQPCPIGVAGELYIGGVNAARGYLGRAELTAQRFVPDPFAADPEARLYRTGDRARWLEEGCLEFLGRLDHQVKIRGVRIEPGEIEAALREATEVREAAVVVHPGPDGAPSLVAYVVPRGPALEVAHLRAWLRERLPEVYQPRAIVVVDALPLTASGKLDRKALPAPSVELWGVVEPPRSPAEAVVAGVFSELLGGIAIGREQRFFDLGGHSLLAAMAVTRIGRALGVEVPIRSLFDHASVASLAAHVEALRSQGSTTRAPIVRTAGPPTLSLGQERLWFLDRLGGAPARYHLAFTLRLSGPLQIAALQVAVERLVARHESLRTVVVEVQGRPCAEVLAPAAMALEVVDLTAAADPEGAAREHAAEDARRPFDLSRDVLLRVKLWRLGPDEHLVSLVLHHIAVDGWSMGVLWSELSALYVEGVRGVASALPELPVRYSDVARWQREQDVSEGLAYWRAQLAGGPESLALPHDRPRPRVESFRGATLRFAVERDLVDGLKALCAQEGATSFMGLLAVYQALLARLTGEPDTVVGTAVAHRGRVEVEPLVGFLVSTVALRTRLDGEPSFREVLRRARRTALEAYAHQEVPFERVVEALSPARALDRSPIFQTMLVVHTAGPGPRLEGLVVSLEEIDLGTTKFDLGLAFTERADVFEGAIEYATDLFAPRTIERLVARLKALLGAAIAAPDVPIGRLGWVPDDEYEQVVRRWNDTRAPLPIDTTVTAAFEAQVDRTPHATALIFEGAQLSYGELERRANQVAHHLRALGTGPESLVALALERSFELLVGVLGVLKAGAAYVPLDPRDPDERLTNMLADTGARIVLTQSRFAARTFGAPHVVALDAPGPLAPNTRPEALAGPRNAAYVMFTSGSTGRPKAVVTEHRSLLNRLWWMDEQFPLAADDRVLHKTPYTFDVSVWELLWPLIAGRVLVIARPEGHKDPGYLARLIRDEQVTTLHFVPSMLQVFLERGDVDTLRGVRRVMASGEALSVELVERFFTRLPAAQLWNLYGPTEAAIDVTSWQCHPGSGRASIPIGRPIANTQLYVLDASGTPCPIGVPGELYIGGVNVARGYLGRAELTAQRFVPDPFTAEARLYRTGDRARWLEEGCLEFLGRLDRQVKIRGVRIEPGEIEATLCEATDVREAAVVVRPGPDGAPSLVAYVVARGPGLTVEALRTWLRERLPEAYQPRALVLLEALPLTASGKLDRASLPSPVIAATHGTGERDAPRDERERKLVAMWQRLFQRPVGVRDDFFVLGGHSLLAVQLFSEIEDTFGVDLPLATLFVRPTIEHLASAIAAQQVGDVTGSTIIGLLREGGAAPPLFFVHGVGGGWFPFLETVKSLGEDRAIYGIRAPWPLPATVAELTAHYARAILRRVPTGRVHLCGYSLGGVLAMETARQLSALGGAPGLVGIIDQELPGSGWRTRVPSGLADVARLLSVMRRRGARDLVQTALRGLAGRNVVEAAAPPWDDTADAHEAEQALATLMGGYRPRAFERGLTLFRAERKRLLADGSGDLGWRLVAAGGLDIVHVPGGHGSMMRAPHAWVLARELACRLRAADASI